MPPFSDDFEDSAFADEWEIPQWTEPGPTSIRQEGGALVFEGTATQPTWVQAAVRSLAGFDAQDFNAEVQVLAEGSSSAGGGFSVNVGLGAGGGSLQMGLSCMETLYGAACGVFNVPDPQPMLSVPSILGRVVTLQIRYSRSASTVSVRVPELSFEVTDVPVHPAGALDTLKFALSVWANLSAGDRFRVNWLNFKTNLGGGDGYIASRSVFEMNGISYSDAVEGTPGPLYWTMGPIGVYKDGVSVPGLDGERDANGYLVTASAPMLPRPFHFTIFTPLSGGELLAAIPLPPEIAVMIDAEFPSVWRKHGYGQNYEFVMPSIGPPEPPLSPKVVTVVDGYNPVGYLRPIPDSNGVFTDAFDDRDVWQDNWIPIGDFRTVPNVILADETVFFGLPEQPGVVMQSAGGLYTEEFNGISAVASSRSLPLEGLEAQVTAVPTLNRRGIVAFGAAIGKDLPGVHVVCIEFGAFSGCDILRDFRSAIDFQNAFPVEGRLSGRTLTMRLSIAGGIATGEVPEVGFRRSMPFDSQLDVQDPSTGQTSRQSKLLPIVLTSLIQGMGHVRWDNLHTNQVQVPRYSYEASVTPLALDGVPYDFVLFPVPDISRGSIGAIGDPYASTTPPAVLDLFNGVIGQFAGLRPGPASGNVFAAMARDPRLENVAFLVSLIANADNFRTDFTDGVTPVHAVLVTDPETGKRSTIYVASPIDPQLAVTLEDPILLANPDPADPQLTGIDGIVLNVFTPVLDGEGNPTGEYRFRLPKPQPKLAALSVPPSVTLTLPLAPDPQPPAPAFPAVCVYEDQTLRLQTPLFDFPTPTDSIQKILMNALLTRLCSPELTYSSSDPSVAQVVLENGSAVLKAYAPGETLVHARFDGVSNDSIVRVVQAPPTSAGAFGASTQPTLLEPVAIEANRLEASTSVHQTLSHKVRVRPAAPVSFITALSACTHVRLDGKAKVTGGIESNRPCEELRTSIGLIGQLAAEQSRNSEIGLGDKLRLKDRQTLSLPGGFFVLESVKLDGKSRLVATSDTVVFVTGKMKLEGQARIEGGIWIVVPPSGEHDDDDCDGVHGRTAPARTAGRKHPKGESSECDDEEGDEKGREPKTRVKIAGHAVFGGVLVAPDAHVKITGHSRVWAPVLGQHVRVSGHAEVNVGGLPIQTLIPLGTGGTSTKLSVSVSLDYRPADFGPFGTGSPVFGSITRTLVHSITLSGTEVPENDGFIPISIPMVFDARDNSGLPLPSSAYNYSGSVDFILTSSLTPGPQPLAPVLASIPIGNGLVSVDNTPPSLTVKSPVNGGIANQLHGHVIALTDDPTSVGRMTLNGAEIGPPVAFSTSGLAILTDPINPPLLAEKINTWVISARDPLGNESVVSAVQTRDTQPPWVTILAPQEGTVTNASTATVSFEISDTGTGPVQETIRILRASALDGAILEYTPTCAPILGSGVEDVRLSCTAPVVLSEGINSLRLRAFDAAGNGGADAVTVEVDTQPPVLTLSRFRGDDVGWFCTSQKKPAYVFYARDPEPGGRSFKVPPGDVFPQGFNVELPAEGFIGPLASGIDLSTARFLIDGSESLGISDVLNGCSSASISICQQPIELDGGCHSIDIRVKDYAGNEGSLVQGFITDLDPPNVVVSRTPPEPIQGQQTHYTYTVDYSDATGPDGCGCGLRPESHQEYALRKRLFGRFGAAPSEEGFDFSYRPSVVKVSEFFGDNFIPGMNFPVGPLSGTMHYTVDYREGKHTFVGIIADVTSRYTQSTDDVLIDLSAPDTSVYPENGQKLNWQITAVSVFGGPLATPIDLPIVPMISSGIDPATVSMTLDGRVLTPALTFGPNEALKDQVVYIEGPIPADLMGDGTHAYQVSYADRAGHGASAQGTYCQDRQRPIATIISPTDGEVFYTDTVDITAVVTDPSPSCGLGEPHVGGAGLIKSSSYSGGTLTAKVKFPEGLDVRFRVNVDDQAGNLSETTELSIKIDLGRPTARVLDLANGGSLHPWFECHSVRIEAYDQNGISDKWLEVDGERKEVAQIMGSNYGTCVPVLEQGQAVLRAPLKLSRGGHVLVAKAVDTVGRNASSDPVYIGVSGDSSLSFLMANMKAPTPFASPADLQTAMQNLNPMALSEEDWLAALGVMEEFLDPQSGFDDDTKSEAARGAARMVALRQDLANENPDAVPRKQMSLVMPIDLLNQALGRIANRDGGFSDGEVLPEFFCSILISDVCQDKQQGILKAAFGYFGVKLTSLPTDFFDALLQFIHDFEGQIHGLQFRLNESSGFTEEPDGRHYDIKVHLQFDSIVITDGRGIRRFLGLTVGPGCEASWDNKVKFENVTIDFTLHPAILNWNVVPQDLEATPAFHHRFIRETNHRLRMVAPGGVNVTGKLVTTVPCLPEKAFKDAFLESLKTTVQASIDENQYGQLVFDNGCGSRDSAIVPNGRTRVACRNEGSDCRNIPTDFVDYCGQDASLSQFCFINTRDAKTSLSTSSCEVGNVYVEGIPTLTRVALDYNNSAGENVKVYVEEQEPTSPMVPAIPPPTSENPAPTGFDACKGTPAPPACFYDRIVGRPSGGRAVVYQVNYQDGRGGEQPGRGECPYDPTPVCQ